MTRTISPTRRSNKNAGRIKVSAQDMEMKADTEEEDAEAAAEAEDSAAEEDEDSRFFRRFPTFPFLFLLSATEYLIQLSKSIILRNTIIGNLAQ